MQINHVQNDTDQLSIFKWKEFVEFLLGDPSRDKQQSGVAKPDTDIADIPPWVGEAGALL